MEPGIRLSQPRDGGAVPLANPDIGPQVERYFINQAPSTRDHLRLLAVAADLVQSSFGARTQLYERLQSGEPDRMRRRLYERYAASDSPLTDRVLRFIREG